MRIVVHDYAGHPFQVQLSRALAARGHEVLHLHSVTFQTPKGPLERRAGDPATFAIEGVDIGEPFRKRSYVRRLIQERRYGRLLADRVAAFGPDAVVSANTPLDAQDAVQAEARRAGATFVFWVQDLYSVAISQYLRDRIPVLGGLLGARFHRLEARLLRRSDRIVAITSDFLSMFDRWGIDQGRAAVIENWAPVDEITPLPKNNAWAVEHGLAEETVFLYAGTLGLKHDPAILLSLAKRLPDAKVVVVSEGPGADWLLDQGASTGNVRVLPFQPFERLPEIIASADVVLAILEPTAGTFSVPSKIFTFLAAGRPILAAIPRENLAALTIDRAGAGVVVRPGDVEGFVAAARALLASPDTRATAGRAGRAYAEANFDIAAITDRFEAILQGASESGLGVAASARSDDHAWPSPVPKVIA
jgi:glycosyltransferase involved in cell wall biosynthesis